MRIKKASDALTNVVALIDVGRKTIKAIGSKEPLEDARETEGETTLVPGKSGIVAFL